MKRNEIDDVCEITQTYFFIIITANILNMYKKRMCAKKNVKKNI